MTQKQIQAEMDYSQAIENRQRAINELRDILAIAPDQFLAAEAIKSYARIIAVQTESIYKATAELFG